MSTCLGDYIVAYPSSAMPYEAQFELTNWTYAPAIGYSPQTTPVTISGERIMPSKSTIGTLLIALGVLAWIVYFGLRFFTPLDPPVLFFLIWHLLGVVPGVTLRGSKLLPRVVAALRRG